MIAIMCLAMFIRDPSRFGLRLALLLLVLVAGITAIVPSAEQTPADSFYRLTMGGYFSGELSRDTAAFSMVFALALLWADYVPSHRRIAVIGVVSIVVFQIVQKAFALDLLGQGLAISTMAAMVCLALAILTEILGTQVIRLPSLGDRLGQLTFAMLLASLVVPLSFELLIEGRTESAPLNFKRAAVTTAIIILFGAFSLTIIRLLRRVQEQEVRVRVAENIARHDLLTGALSRRGVYQWLRQERAHSHVAADRMALLLTDLDDFKEINDAYGHPVGDRILRETAKAFLQVAPRHTVLSRWGGDEFLALVPFAGPCEIRRLHSGLQARLENLVASPGHPAQITTTMGVVAFDWPVAPSEFQTHLSRADELLYAAKRGGRGRLVLCPTLLEDENGSLPERESSWGGASQQPGFAEDRPKKLDGQG